MMSENKEIRDVHKIENTLEILTRSPHNRFFLMFGFINSVLLRYNHFEEILLKWLGECSKTITAIATGEAISLEDAYLSLCNIMHIIYNFMPTLETCSWFTLKGAFSEQASNLLSNINHIFGSLVWYVWNGSFIHSMSLAGHEECVIDYSWEMTVITCKLKELIANHSMPKKWVVLLHQYILITANNIPFLQSSTRADRVLRLLTQTCEGAGQWLFGKMPATALEEEELMTLNMDMMILLLNVCNGSDAIRIEAYHCGCYVLVNTISLIMRNDRFLNHTS